MKAVIVTGDRHAQRHEWDRVVDKQLALLSRNDRLVVIHGNGSGIDSIAHGIACDSFPMSAVPVIARWDLHGKSAGPRRNTAMLSMLRTLCEQGYGIEVLAFHNDLSRSKGTKDLVNQAVRADIRVSLCTTSNDPILVTSVLL